MLLVKNILLAEMQTTEALNKDAIRELLSEERDGIPPEVLSYIYDQKLFRLFIPKQLNGLELSVPEALPVLRDCAHTDGTYGWLVQIGSGGGYFTVFFDPELQQEIVSRPEFVIAGSGYPGAKAKRTEGGYLIGAGFWKYCSGSQYATLFTANCELDGEIKPFAFLPDEISIVMDWDAYGLKGTSGNSMQTAPLFLPTKRAFDLHVVRNHYGYPLHRYPFEDFAIVVLSSTLAGCFLRLMDEVEKIAHKRSIVSLVKSVEKNRQIADARWEKLISLTSVAWEKLLQNKPLSNDGLLQSIQSHVHETTSLLFEAAAAAYYYCGMEASYQHEPFNRVWRDFTTLCQHQMIKENFT